MDISKPGESGNLGCTAVNGGESLDLNGQKGGLENGFHVGEELFVENDTEKIEKIVNGNFKFAADGEDIPGRYAHENISDSVVDDSNSSNDSGQLENEVNHTNGNSVNFASEFSEIQIQPKGIRFEEDNGGDNETPMTGGGGESNSPENGISGDGTAVSSSQRNGELQIVRPLSQLPKPEAPPSIINSLDPHHRGVQRSQSLPEKLSVVDMPTIGKFFREKGNSFSAAIAKRLSGLTERENEEDDDSDSLYSNVTEFKLSGLKVVVKLKTDDLDLDLQLKGRISIFTRSNCRDCGAVRSFFRERGLRFAEINIDVYPMREKELIERTGSSSVPQIFFNENLFGGLVALNSLRNSSGMFEQRLKEMLGRKCPDDAPSPPVYGFDDPDELDERTDDMIGIVRVLRQRLPIQDRLMKMKIVKNCFAGAEMVEVIIHHLDCGRKKAIEVGKQLARKHFIHHVFGENEFEDGNHFYRFLEHEPFIPKCFNFRGSTNDGEPKPAATISQRLIKIISAILESYASEDRHHVNYRGISNSEEFRRYVNLALELQRVNILELSEDEKLAFFLNLHNAMVIHAVIRVGHPEGVIDRRSFYSDFQYLVGGHPYSLSTIRNGILRSNRRPPYSLVKPFGALDQRLELACIKFNRLIHFGLCNGTRSSPTLRFYTPQGVDSELRRAAREFFQGEGMEVDLSNRTVYLTRIIKWFDVDFGREKEILNWILNYLDATKAGLLTHLLGDGGPIKIVYQDYDWSVNS